jgi:hypothetical protein
MNKQAMHGGAHACNPVYLGGVGSRIVVQGWPGKKHETPSKK